MQISHKVLKQYAWWGSLSVRIYHLRSCSIYFIKIWCWGGLH